MEERHFPFPMPQKPGVVLTEDEKKAIFTAMNSAWKLFQDERPDIKAKVVRANTTHEKWLSLHLSFDAKKAKLEELGISVPDKWISEGWPYHGMGAKLSKFRGSLTRIHYCLLTSGLPEERIKEIRQHLHVLEDLDKQFLKEAETLSGKIDQQMNKHDAPKTQQDLVAALSPIAVDAGEYVDRYMAQRQANNWAEFDNKYKETRQPAPVKKPVEDIVEDHPNPPMDL